MRLLFMVWFAFLSVWGLEGYNGKSALLTLPSPSGIVSFNDRNISVLLHPTDRSKGIAIVPVDYYTPMQEMNLTWSAPGRNEIIPITIRDSDYSTEELSVDPALVTPPPEALERIAAEKAQAEAIYARFTPIRYWNEPFIHPMDSNITSEYGSKRTYNGSLKSYHGGVDFRARTPLPISAVNNGIVVLTADRYYAGGTVIIDHGEGIYSCYFHMSRFDVKPGDYVKRGDTLGLSGATGRITGPHLHFGIVIGGVQSDPLYFIDRLNTLFTKETDETLTLR